MRLVISRVVEIEGLGLVMSEERARAWRVWTARSAFLALQVLRRHVKIVVTWMAAEWRAAAKL